MDHDLGQETTGYTVTDAGPEALAGLPDLQVIGLAGTQVSEDGLKRLRKAKR